MRDAACWQQLRDLLSSATMKRDWKKRALSYLVLVGVLVGALWSFQKSPVDVDTVVDLTNVRLLDGVPLIQLKVDFLKGEEWVCSTSFAFPESRYPSGPPGNTDVVAVKMLPGTHTVNLEFTYAAEGKPEVKQVRSMLVEVAAAGRLEIKADQARP